ncbi:MAG: hypothetical protein DI547_12930 [Sphingobium sp.]|jgi:hypothetical protein|nr:MAG: hypothetical protein DI547_12930 [Sphingobium sp.]
MTGRVRWPPDGIGRAIIGAALLIGVLLTGTILSRASAQTATDKPRADTSSGIDQIGTREGGLDAGAQEQIDAGRRGADAHETGIEQLPRNARLTDDDANPEQEIGVVDSADGRRALYDEVAGVWQTIRQRGQQPTPELIAREIGPEALSQFLNSFPGANTIFGIDSDIMPLKPPEGADALAARGGDGTSMPKVDQP